MKKIRLHNIVSRCNPAVDQELRLACEARDVEYIPVDPISFSFANSPKVQRGDLVYRTDTGGKSSSIQRWFAMQEIVTLHAKHDRIFYSFDSFSRFRAQKIPQPKTIDWLPRKRKNLQAAVKALGGFPVILKVTGGSHGVGVIKVDSLSSLLSMSDYLHGHSNRVIMRQFIPGGHSARLIVLGKKVIDSIEYRAPRGDFRSNVDYEPMVSAKKFSSSVEKLAIKAVQALELEFGGVDILVHKGKGYVAETNFPCFFPRCSRVTGTDIAGKIVDHLLKKRKRIFGSTRVKK